MVPDNKNELDPTVQAIVEMFPEDFLRNTARETGVVERERKIDVVILFWVTTLGFGVRFLSTIRGLKRKYEEKAKTTLSISSFYDRFTPEMVDFLRKCVLHAIEFQAQQIGRILDANLKREILDVEVEVEFKRRKYKGKQSTVKRRFRVVCAFNPESGGYHAYLTNIRVEILSAEDIALLYRARWEIELIFKELKSNYRMDQIPSANPNIVKCLIWVAILTLMCSRRILQLIRNANPENADRYTHLRWAKVFTQQADRLLTEVVECMGLKLDMLTIYDIYLGQ